MNRLQEKYRKEVIRAMQEKFGYRTLMAVPRIEKAVVNTGFGRVIGGKTGDEQRKIIEEIKEMTALICGQEPIVTLAKKSVAGFKVRKAMPLGVKATLRGSRMYDFLDRLVSVALPRSRDFQGIAKEAFDKKGNLSIGIKEHIFFPEIAPEKVKHHFGLQITVATNAKTKEEGVELLRMLGFPIKP